MDSVTQRLRGTKQSHLNILLADHMEFNYSVFLLSAAEEDKHSRPIFHLSSILLNSVLLRFPQWQWSWRSLSQRRDLRGRRGVNCGAGYRIFTEAKIMVICPIIAPIMALLYVVMLPLTCKLTNQPFTGGYEQMDSSSVSFGFCKTPVFNAVMSAVGSYNFIQNFGNREDGAI